MFRWFWILFTFVVLAKATKLDHFRLRNRHYIVNTELLDYNAANAKCKTFPNGRLVKIDSQAVNMALEKQLKNYSHVCWTLKRRLASFWTAGVRDAEHGFVWNTYQEHGVAELMPFANWNFREPNNRGGHENCLEVMATDNKLLWNDLACNIALCSICEI